MRPGILAALLMAATPAAPPDDRKLEYNRDIRPILADTCFACHGPDGNKRKAGLRLDSAEGATAKLKSGATAIVAGKPESSALVERITAKSEDDVMPPPDSGKKLTAAQIETLRKWVAQGGAYQPHWAFIPPTRPATPGVKNESWCRNPVDRFVLARLEKEGLAPSPEADKVTLLRRLAFDLTGLPPAPADAAAFDFAAAVDRLLASPHYGERLALPWLDLVRYADSRGYHSDNPRNVGAYRDYVIRAFNENMPFDRFTVENLAGDLLPEATIWQRVASGYNKLNQTTEEGGAQAREYEAKTVADRVRNVSGVWMGATLGCAECHDHKFDPFSTRDFYRLGAFFADIQEGAIGDGDKGIPVLDPTQTAAVAEIDAKLAALRKTLDTPTPELEKGQAEWEKRALASTPWTTLAASKLTSKGKATLAAQADGAVLVGGTSPAKDTHTVEIKTDLKGITAIRLEALADPSLPANGPGRAGNGNFVLTGFKVRVGTKDAAFARAIADHSQDGFPIAHAIDASNETGWATLPAIGKDNSALFELKEPLPDGPLSVILEYQSVHGQHVIGRFRLSATTLKEPAAAAPLPAKVRTALEAGEKRSDAQMKDLAGYFRSISPLLKPARSEVATLEARRAELTGKARRSLVANPGAPRMVRVLPRGNWLDGSGEAVTPGVPASLPALDTGARRATRLDLAKWLVDRRHPLTARVFVNRLWKHFYGQGISRSLDDLGAQGEWPVHPELLDWLAVEFMESGWDVKHMVKLLVSTSAYRQSSAAPKPLRERDPQNRLIARQSRFRHDAEIVRDNALALSGLLVPAVGGDSVRPYQPKGYWYHLNFPKREWQDDAGPNAWRRGIYTWWQRTFHHPSMVAFDAPSREESCAERARSNIPQQALVLLNDPTYVEAARVFAARILREGGASDDARLAWAFLQVLTRAPTADEARVLTELRKKHREKYAADPKAAAALLAVGQAPAPKDADPVELASWTSVARTLLNLHETITRF